MKNFVLWKETTEMIRSKSKYNKIIIETQELTSFDEDLQRVYEFLAG